MKVYALNTLKFGQDTINAIGKTVPITGVIGLSNRDADDAISDYEYQKPYCDENNLEFVEVDSYVLKKQADKDKLQNLEIDVLIICGWQRLVPEWLINNVKIGILGFHGSAYGITKGRGRSPQNWAFILDKKEFFISVFKVDPGIDSGQILRTRRFELSTLDDIETSYLKVVWNCGEMIRDILKELLEGGMTKLTGEVQDDSEASYMPKRTPDDGFIDWNLTASEIHNIVRGLTRPYPGATTKLNGQTIRLWQVIPFNVDTSEHFETGEVAQVFKGKYPVVKCKDSFVLIKDYSAETAIEAGMVLESVDYQQTLSTVIERHEKQFPDFPVAEDLKEKVKTYHK